MLKSEPADPSRDAAAEWAATAAARDTPDMICPNPACPHLGRYGAPAELPDGTRACPACGGALARRFSPDTDDLEPGRLITVARFGEPCAAHLARGRLESEGVPARVIGEHLATLSAIFTDTGGLIRLEVPSQEVGRAVEILRRDHAGAAAAGEDAGNATTSMRVCRRCGSASIAAAVPIGPRGILARIIGALDPRRNQRLHCLTCGHRWRGAEKD